MLSMHEQNQSCKELPYRILANPAVISKWALEAGLSEESSLGLLPYSVLQSSSEDLSCVTSSNSLRRSRISYAFAAKVATKGGLYCETLSFT